MKFLHFFIFSIFIFTFFSCANDYEKRIIGSYVVYKFKITDDSKEDLIINYHLILYKNKKFKFDLGNKKIEGNWSAGDDGDRIWIEFENENFNQKGVVLGKNLEIISFLNPNHFTYQNLKELSFTRTD